MYYTGNGDGGTSSLFSSDEELAKGSPIFEVLGTLDELSSYLGVCRAKAQTENMPVIRDIIKKLQEDQFIIQAELAGSNKNMRQKHIDDLEAMINKLSTKVPRIINFTIPGSTELSAHIDYARTVARRCERMLIRLGENASSTYTRVYMNRLSSALFVLARYSATKSGQKEPSPKYK